jgi:hypothetical protein
MVKDMIRKETTQTTTMTQGSTKQELLKGIKRIGGGGDGGPNTIP